MKTTTNTLNTLKNNAITNNDSKGLKAFNLIELLFNSDNISYNEILNTKNNTIEYEFNIDNNYSLYYQPYRNEIILYFDNTRYMEIYPNKQGYSIYTRGYYLLKVVFKDTKKDNAIKNILISNISYHPKNDMKHVFKGLDINITTSLIKKFYHLDYNSKLEENAFVKKDEDLGSKKSIYLVNRQDDEEEESE